MSSIRNNCRIKCSEVKFCASHRKGLYLYHAFGVVSWFVLCTSMIMMQDSHRCNALQTSVSSRLDMRKKTLRLYNDYRIWDDDGRSVHANTFASLGLSFEFQQAAIKNEWNAPTEVQRKAIPLILGQKNRKAQKICVEAKTGSGKTAAYLLPLMQKVLKEKQEDFSIYGKSPKVVRALIVVPTRELCIQVSQVLDMIKSSESKKRVTLSSSAIYGGVPIEPQMEAFYSLFLDKNEEKFPDIVVATPGRLVDVLSRFDEDPTDLALEKKLIDALDKKNRGRDATVKQKQIKDEKLDSRFNTNNSLLGKSLLKSISTLVFDEADRLCANEFQDEIDNLMSLLQARNEESKLQKIFVSATFPKSIKPRMTNLFATLDKVSGQTGDEERIFHIKGESSDLDNKDQISTPPTTIIQRVIRLEEKSRTQALRNLIESGDPEEWKKVLCFVSTRYQSEIISKKLRRVGINALELHGKLDQQSRSTRLKKFKTGKAQVLIATDLASRGLDIKGLPVVVNYDLPRSPEGFTHRIGRTGRAGKSGMAISFITPASESHFNLIERKVLKAKMFRETLHGFEPDEEAWSRAQSESQISPQGTQHSTEGLAHDKMYGGIKGKRKSKKDKLREAAAAAAATAAEPISEESLYS